MKSTFQGRKSGPGHQGVLVAVPSWNVRSSVPSPDLAVIFVAAGCVFFFSMPRHVWEPWTDTDEVLAVVNLRNVVFRNVERKRNQLIFKHLQTTKPRNQPTCEGKYISSHSHLVKIDSNKGNDPSPAKYFPTWDTKMGKSRSKSGFQVVVLQLREQDQ